MNHFSDDELLGLLLGQLSAAKMREIRRAMRKDAELRARWELLTTIATSDQSPSSARVTKWNQRRWVWIALVALLLVTGATVLPASGVARAVKRWITIDVAEDCQLFLQIPVDGHSELFIDDTRLPQEPDGLLPVQVFLSPGEHIVTLKRFGRTILRQTIEGIPGKRIALREAVNGETIEDASFAIRYLTCRSVGRATLEIRQIAFAKNDEQILLAMGNYDTPPHDQPGVAWYDIQQNAIRPQMVESTGVPSAVLASENGTQAWTVWNHADGPSKLRVYSAAGESLLAPDLQHGATRLAITPDGQTLVAVSEVASPSTAQGGVTRYDLQTRTTSETWLVDTTLYSVAVSSDGRLIAAGGGHWTDWGHPQNAGFIQVWDRDGRVRFTSQEHTLPVLGLAISPDGKLLSSASADQTVRVWDLSNGQLLHTLRGHQFVVETVAFSPAGLLASGSWDMTVKLWNPVRGTPLATVKRTTGYVQTVQFSHSGRTLAAAGADGTIHLWQIEPTSLP